MNKNSAAAVLTGILLALAASGAAAQSALEQLGAQAGGDASALLRQLKDMRAMDAGSAPVVAAAPRRKDAFKNCSALDALPFLPWNVSQAASRVQSCLNRAYASDGGYRVQAQPARFGSRACPDGTMTCRAIIEVVGIKITVSGRVLTGDPVLLDLSSSLDRRGDKLLGFEATVDNRAAVLR